MDLLPVGTISLRDSTGSLGYLRAWMVGATSEATARTALSELSGLLASASDAVVVGYSVAYQTILTDARGAGDGGRLLVMVFAADGTDEYGLVKLPGAPADMFGPDGAALPGDARVAALAAALSSGPWANPFGVDLLELLTAIEGEARQG